MVQDRAISVKFLTPGYPQTQLVTFAKNCFPTTFGGHLEFLPKTQKHIYLGKNVRQNF